MSVRSAAHSTRNRRRLDRFRGEFIARPCGRAAVRAARSTRARCFARACARIPRSPSARRRHRRTASTCPRASYRRGGSRRGGTAAGTLDVRVSFDAPLGCRSIAGQQKTRQTRRASREKSASLYGSSLHAIVPAHAALRSNVSIMRSMLLSPREARAAHPQTNSLLAACGGGRRKRSERPFDGSADHPADVVRSGEATSPRRRRRGRSRAPTAASRRTNASTRQWLRHGLGSPERVNGRCEGCVSWFGDAVRLVGQFGLASLGRVASSYASSASDCIVPGVRFRAQEFCASGYRDWCAKTQQRKRIRVAVNWRFGPAPRTSGMPISAVEGGVSMRGQLQPKAVR